MPGFRASTSINAAGWNAGTWNRALSELTRRHVRIPGLPHDQGVRWISRRRVDSCSCYQVRSRGTTAQPPRPENNRFIPISAKNGSHGFRHFRTPTTRRNIASPPRTWQASGRTRASVLPDRTPSPVRVSEPDKDSEPVGSISIWIFQVWRASCAYWQIATPIGLALLAGVALGPGRNRSSVTSGRVFPTNPYRQIQHESGWPRKTAAPCRFILQKAAERAWNDGHHSPCHEPALPCGASRSPAAWSRISPRPRTDRREILADIRSRSHARPGLMCFSSPR